MRQILHICGQLPRSRHTSTPCRGFAPLGHLSGHPWIGRKISLSFLATTGLCPSILPGVDSSGVRLKPQPPPAHEPPQARPPPLHPYALNLSADIPGVAPPLRGGAVCLSSPSAVACWRCTSSSCSACSTSAVSGRCLPQRARRSGLRASDVRFSQATRCSFIIRAPSALLPGEVSRLHIDVDPTPGRALNSGLSELRVEIRQAHPIVIKGLLS